MKVIHKALITLLLANINFAYASEPSALNEVQAFYKRVLSYNYYKTPDLPRPKMDFSKSFTKELEQNSKICAEYATGICGWQADGDEYLDAQDIDPELTYENSGIEFKELKKNVIQVKLNVYPSVTDAKDYYLRTITYQMIREKNLWVVDDITYTNGVSSRAYIKEENANYLANPDPDSPAAKKRAR